MPKVYGETERLTLRALDRSELPRMVNFLDTWDIARCLCVLPHPYTLKNAEEFHLEMENADANGDPQFFAVATKDDGLLIGGVGLHPPRGGNAPLDETEIGYWLGREYWGRGFMSEAAKIVVDFAFNRPLTASICATTSVDNVASQNVLRKLGLRNLGEGPRNYLALRGDNTVVNWRLTRNEWIALRS